MESSFSDDRFSHVRTDPKFRSMPKKERKVKIDKRFQGMFNDSRFKLKYTVDKKGRPLNKSSDEDLKRFYELSDEGENSSDSEEDDQQLTKTEKNLKGKKKDKGNKLEKPLPSEKLDTEKAKKNTKKKLLNKQKKTRDIDEELDNVQKKETDSEDSDESGVGTGPDLARGEGNASSSDEEEEVDWKPDTGVDIEHNWGEEEKQIPGATELGHRLAVCNMDWDRIKATDLFVLFSSFNPTGGIIHSVTVYPSEYGERMIKEENTKGPAQLISNSTAETTTKDEEDDGEGSDFHMERLRQYQLNRLKYYYAVVDCDSITTASHIYDECDGLEYETSSARIDLRFIPDDMEFDQTPHSLCKENPDSSTFEPTTFLTTALCQSKVELTWDETERDRLVVSRKPLKPEEIEDADYKAYLASSSEDEQDPYNGLLDNSGSDPEEEEEEEGSKIEKYKSLVKELEDSEKAKGDRGVEMEITWEPGLKETTEEIVKKKSGTKDLTVWEQYLAKRKDKKIQKREEKIKEKEDRETNNSKGIEEPGEPGDEAAFSDDDLPEGIDVNDPYFKSELQPNIDNKTGVNKKKGKKSKVKLTEAEQKQVDQKQAELSLLMMDGSDGDNKQHFNLRKLLKSEKSKKKRKRKTETESENVQQNTFEFNVDDSRFKAMYDSHLYNIDPSAPEFKRTKVMDTLIEEKLKQRKKTKKIGKDKMDTVSDNNNGTTKTYVKDSSISALVSSVKSKTKNFHKKK